jgi:hypothetical protein
MRSSRPWLPSLSALAALLTMTAPLIASLLTMITASPVGAECIDYSQRLHFVKEVHLPGTAFGIAAAGGYAYIATADLTGLQALDLADPEDPRVVGSASLEGIPGPVAVAGSHAYVGVGAYQLVVFDIANPASPAAVGSVVLLDGTTGGMAAQGSFVYVASGPSGLVAVDASDPSDPRIVGSVAMGEARAIQMAGGHAYLLGHTTETDRLLICDLSAPSAPSVVGEMSLPGNAAGFAVAGNRAYIAEFIQGESFLQVIDVTESASPHEIGNVRLPESAFGVVAVRGNYAYLTVSSGLLVVDVSDPAYPRLAGRLFSPSNGVVRMITEGDFGLLVGGTAAAAVIRLGDPVPLLGQVELAGYSTTGLVVADSYAYVLTDTDLHVCDISDPSSPRVLASTGHGGAALAVSGAIAAVATGDALEFWDVSEPASPRFAGVWETSKTSFALDGGYAYLSGGGFQVIDISDPAHPQLVAGIDTSPVSLGQVLVSGGYAYVSAIRYGGRPGNERAVFVVIEISDPAHPRVVGETEQYIPALPNDLAVFGHLVYGTSWAGLLVIDVADPAHPVVLSRTADRGADANGIAARNGYAYLAGSAGLQVADLSDPLFPRDSGELYVGVAYRDVAVSGSYAYLVGGAEARPQLFVLPAQCGATSEPLPSFALDLPLDQSDVYSVHPVLRWHPVPRGDSAGPIHYMAYWSLDPLFLDASSISAGTDTFCVVGPEALQLGSTYRWRVVARDAADRLGWSEPTAGRSFFATVEPEPCGISARITAFGVIVITWWVQSPGDIADFQVYRRVLGGDWIAISPMVPWANLDCSYRDDRAEPGIRYDYRVVGLGSGGDSCVSSIVSAELPPVPRFEVRLERNPGKGVVQLLLSLPRTERVTMSVIDLQGRVVARTELSEVLGGLRPVQWEPHSAGGALPSGAYVVVVEAGGERRTVRWVVLR